MKFVIGLDGSGAAEAAEKVEALANSLQTKTQEVVNRLAERGVQLAKAYFQVPYDGDGSVSVDWEERGDCVTAVVATGQAVLFLEFGAGYMMGYGHPEPMGYGPGTYPGKGYWNNPNGWIYDHHKPRSYGNPPSAAMYTARKELATMIEQIAMEVFR